MVIDKMATTGPRISIVTITRNSCEFVKDTIKSVLGQGYGNVEYIVVDGGSTDGTVGIIKSYEAEITKWVSEPDEGISDAFNKGLSFTTGDYVLFLNSDDALANSEVLAKVAQIIIKNNFPILIYGDCDVLDRSSGKVLYRASIQLSHKGLKRGQMLPQPSLFTHRSYFEKYGVFDNHFKIAMDYEWLLRGGLKEEIVHMPLLVTRVRGGGISTFDQARVVDEIISASKKNKYISTKWAEFKMRGYYFGRTLAKSILGSIGLYRAFSFLRNRLAKPAGGDTASRGWN